MKWRETKEKPCHSKIGIQIYFPSTLKRPIVHATGKYFFQLRFNNDGFLSSCVSQALSTFFPAWFFLSTCLLITYSVVGDSSVSIAFCLCFSSAPPPLSLSACYISTPPLPLDPHSAWFACYECAFAFNLIYNIFEKRKSKKKTLKCQWRLITGRKIAAD